MKKTAIIIETENEETMLSIIKFMEWTPEQIKDIYKSWGTIKQIIDIDNLSIDCLL